MTATERMVLAMARQYATARAAFFAHEVTDADSKREDDRLNEAISDASDALLRAAEKMG